MHVTLVQINVKPEHVDDFIVACQHNHYASVKEPGNMRFDILQSSDDPYHFILYEAYADADAAAAHKHTQHYLMWREKVANWMASPREGKLFNGLYPAD